MQTSWGWAGPSSALAGAWYRDEFGKIYLLSNFSEISVSICSYFVSIIDNFLTFEMWDGIFCTFYADSFFKWKIMTSFLGKFDTQKIISHRCQLGDKVCRMKGSHQWVDYNIRVSRKHILCYFHQGCHIPILFLEGGGEFSPLCPWIPERRIRFCRKILDIIGIFRPSQANTFDFAQRSMAQ